MECEKNKEICSLEQFNLEHIGLFCHKSSFLHDLELLCVVSVFYLEIC